MSTRLPEGWPGWWGPDGPEYLAWLGEQREAGYTVLMGANTYRDMSGYAAEGEPGTDALAGLSNVDHVERAAFWANTQLVARDPVEAGREMKGKGSKSMRTMRSLTLCRSLLNAGLVDRFRVVVFPSSPEAAAGADLRRLSRPADSYVLAGTRHKSSGKLEGDERWPSDRTLGGTAPQASRSGRFPRSATRSASPRSPGR
jgi:dihydrofolate reductase